MKKIQRAEMCEGDAPGLSAVGGDLRGVLVHLPWLCHPSVAWQGKARSRMKGVLFGGRTHKDLGVAQS